MGLNTNALLGHGGTGMQGAGADSVAGMVRELQGLRVSLVTGGAADTKFDLAAIRGEDTIVSALNNNAGTLTDITGTVSIVDLRASGTITVGTAAAGDTVSVDGQVFTLVAEGTAVAAHDYTKVVIGADADATAAALADAINRWEANRAAPEVSASAAAAVVTLTARAEGTGGNSVALAEAGTSFTVSGETLAGGSDTGGIQSSGITNQIVLYWFNKK